MITYATAAEVEAVLGRAMTWAEAAWFRYSAATPDYCLYYHTMVIMLIIYTLVPLPLTLLELWAPVKLTSPYKLQPRVRRTATDFVRCYKDTMLTLLTGIGPHLVSYRAIKIMRIRTGLPLPSVGEMVAQLLVYFLVYDYLAYWYHRLMHMPRLYKAIHHVHHEYVAPMGFAAVYGHWVDVITPLFLAFVGPAIVPCHMTTLWLWLVLLVVETINMHTGFSFPFNPTKFVPFYSGAEYHDYHHFVGGQSQSNFAVVFTFCDYIYGTDKGYRYHKMSVAKMKNMAICSSGIGREAAFNSTKQE